MKLFDYDSHALVEAKKLSNPNISANLKFLGLPNDNFKKAEISFYIPTDLNSNEFTFIDALDLFESKQNLTLFTTDQSNEIYFVKENNEWCFYFKSSSQGQIKKQFKVQNGDEKSWELVQNQNSNLKIAGSFSNANIKIKKLPSSDISDDTYIYVKCILTRDDDKSGVAWGRILLKKELPSDTPNLTLNYHFTL